MFAKQSYGSALWASLVVAAVGCHRPAASSDAGAEPGHGHGGHRRFDDAER